jgi:aspartate-semialdehyde dehydrogenase
MMNIAIVGATGNVGRKILEVLEKKNFSLDNLYLVASSKSAGSKITFKDKELEVFDLEKFDFSKAKITFFCSRRKNIRKLCNKSCTTFDCNRQFKFL